ncbi:vitamin K epoxide reductase family protein [Aquimarina sp. 2201CG1-2-11]|uniref:vitamin K epoxide reductase family protein n=1 Tax=Aquimarina discodermiae TaxID=3231043 RepID=UPI003462591E
MDYTLLSFFFLLKKELNLKTTKNRIENTLLKHKSYPSLFSFSDSLKKIGVNNKVVKISAKEFVKLSPLFLAYTLEDGLVIVKELSDTQISYKSESKKNLTESLNDFLLKWNGIVIVLDDQSSGNISKKELYLKKIKTLRTIGIYVCFSLLIILFFDFQVFTNNALLIVKIIGVIVSSYLITIKEDKLRESKFCTLRSKIDCSSVLSSKGAKIFSWLSLLDLSIVYFFAGLITLVLSSSGGNFLGASSFLNIASLLVLPIIFFSIYYQGFKLKKWCFFCLMISGLVLTESFISLYQIANHRIFFSVHSFLVFLFSFLFVILFWSHFKRFIVSYFKLKYDMYKYVRLKKNEDVFSALQEKEAYIETNFKGNKIILGNSNSKNIISLVFSVDCSLCKKKLIQISSLYKNDSNVCFSLIFSESSNNDVAAFFIELYHNTTQEKFIAAIKHWFSNESLKLLKEQYPIIISKNSEEILENHIIWCEQNNIIQTPKIIYNNRDLSHYYSIEDIVDNC